jgi:phosphatidate cytidylyltransferase
VPARILGSILVVAVALVPTLVGGPVFAAFMVALGCVGFREYQTLASRISPVDAGPMAASGFAVIVALGIAPHIDQSGIALVTVCVIAIALPLLLLLPAVATPGGLTRWALVSSGSLYLGLPVYTAVSLRLLPGHLEATSLTDIAAQLDVAWDAAPRGLAWTLTILLAIWIGDSTAYLIGRSLGRHKLAPVLSPSKTIEGAISGLAGSMLSVGLLFSFAGLGGWLLGLLTGAVIGLAGQVGDLAESFLKRQAAVKDTGALIPGHGGVLDRIDALLFAFPAGLVLATGYERFGV